MAASIRQHTPAYASLRPHTLVAKGLIHYRYEPFGMAVLEAWACSKPVVVTDKGGPGEFVMHGRDGLKV